MSGRINYSNLSDSLKERLNGLGLTEEQVNELIENALVDKVGELNGLMTEEKGDLVGAINELFQNANNGKELIANAIGEPLNSEDTFSAMSNDINGLLSTFKTNMMNNGITVESGDKFKSLIDKIATMVEEGNGKGIQFAEGTTDMVFTETNNSYNPYTDTATIDIPINLDFEPNIIIITGFRFSQTRNHDGICLINGLDTVIRLDGNSIYGTLKIKEFNKDKITIQISTNNYNYKVSLYSDAATYYAIGVGEEDTTLLDSLKSILAEEGVTTTEEDDMASLISKVDEEFNDKNNEMSSLNTNITLLTNQVNNLTNELAGKVTPAGNAVAANVLTGKTFINSTGQLVTGTMANMSTHTQVADYVAWNTQSIYLGIPAGAYVNASSTGYPEVYIEKTRLDSNLVPGNIVSGKSICGVNGTATAIKVSAGSRFTFYSNTTRSGYFSNANYSNSTGYRYTLEFDGTYTVTGSMYTSYNSVTLYVKVVLADSSGNTIQEFGESSHKTGSTNGGYANTGNLTITGKAGQIIMLYGKCHYSNNTSKAGSHNFNGLTVTGEITKA